MNSCCMIAPLKENAKKIAPENELFYLLDHIDTFIILFPTSTGFELWGIWV